MRKGGRGLSRRRQKGQCIACFGRRPSSGARPRTDPEIKQIQRFAAPISRRCPRRVGRAGGVHTPTPDRSVAACAEERLPGQAALFRRRRLWDAIPVPESSLFNAFRRQFRSASSPSLPPPARASLPLPLQQAALFIPESNVFNILRRQFRSEQLRRMAKAKSQSLFRRSTASPGVGDKSVLR